MEVPSVQMQDLQGSRSTETADWAFPLTMASGEMMNASATVLTTATINTYSLHSVLARPALIISE